MKKLLMLRKKLADLNTRANAKIGEVVDGIADDVRRSIETEHAAILKEIEGLRSEIEAVEAEELAAEERRAAAPLVVAPPAPAVPTVVALSQADVEAAAVRAVNAERTRVATIRADGLRGGMSAAFIEQHINGSTSEAAFRQLVWDDMATRSDRNPQRAHVEVIRDEGETRHRNIAAAITYRLAHASGDRQAALPEHARQYGGMELAEMAAEVINWRGGLRTARQVTEMFERAFHTSSDFPSIFTDSLNNRLLARYQAALATYRLIAQRTTTPDFRATNVIRAGDFPPLQRVNEAGEIKYGTFGESKEQIQTFAYAVALSFSRVMLVNDQLGAIDQVLGSYGARVADFENSLVFSVLLANPTLLTDTTAVFHANHENLVTPGTAINVDNVGIARAMLAKQGGVGTIKLNIAPRVLLTGPDRVTVAEQLLATIVPTQQSNAVPESMRRLVPVSDANITDNSWYLFADPDVAPILHYSYLEGFEGPRLTSENVFDVQGLKVKLEHDFGVNATDYRGAVKNVGA